MGRHKNVCVSRKLTQPYGWNNASLQFVKEEILSVWRHISSGENMNQETAVFGRENDRIQNVSQQTIHLYTG